MGKKWEREIYALDTSQRRRAYRNRRYDRSQIIRRRHAFLIVVDLLGEIDDRLFRLDAGVT